jgi:hypothetical protein
VDNVNCSGSGSDPVVPGDTKNILGFDTIHTHTASTPSAYGSVAFDQWVSLDLDCRPLSSRTTDYDKNGNLVSTSTFDATKVVLGDPPADVFAIAPLPEVPPSQMAAADSATAMTPARIKLLEKRDKQYYNEKAIRDGLIPPPAPDPSGNGYYQIVK